GKSRRCCGLIVSATALVYIRAVRQRRAASVQRPWGRSRAIGGIVTAADERPIGGQCEPERRGRMGPGELEDQGVLLRGPPEVVAGVADNVISAHRTHHLSTQGFGAALNPASLPKNSARAGSKSLVEIPRRYNTGSTSATLGDRRAEGARMALYA